MNIVVLNGSPAGKNSITLYTLLYIQKHFPEHRYEIIHVGRQIRKLEQDPSGWQDALRRADLILFCYPVYTFLAPAQLHRFVELMKGLDLSGKYATQITTSKHFYDVTAHRFIQDNCADMGLKYVRGLSADMDDLRHPQGRDEALAFFRFVLWNMERGYHETAVRPPQAAPAVPAHAGVEALNVAAPKRVVIVADYSISAGGALQAMCKRLKERLPCEIQIVDIIGSSCSTTGSSATGTGRSRWASPWPTWWTAIWTRSRTCRC